ncbi:MAG: Arylsulfatase [candidate division BRC1 bacterium ADurb.BinA364]|nr:MAG: Arylsulfatase [candidate division BRC1 bacterium ADurb.BinA364]
MNVILVISDTVRASYCGCYGSTWVDTPNIDALARESVLMENYYTASFPTGPMRKDTQSGRFTFPYAAWRDERPEGETVLAEWLAAAGAATAWIGDTTNSKQYLHGYEHLQYIGSEGANLASVPERVELPADLRKLRGPESWAMRIARNALAWDGEEDRSCARTMRAAHRWLENRAADPRPFFLCVDTFDPHEPWDPPQYYIERYDPGYTGQKLMEPAYEPAGYATSREILHMRRRYAAKLTMVDRWLGYLLDGVRRMGLRETTAILFTSDHGFYHGEHGLIGKVELGRDNKLTRRWPLYETIAHPPLLLCVPGIEGGKRLDAFCQPPDLAPTILELMGVEKPDRIQGASLAPLLRGEREANRHWAVSSCTCATDALVRAPSMYRTREWLYVYGGDEWASELYNLEIDPAETYDTIKSERRKAQELHDAYLGFLESVAAPANVLDARREFCPTPRAVPPGSVTI